MKSARNLRELEKNHPEGGNTDLEKQTWCILPHKWLLDIIQDSLKKKFSQLRFLLFR